MHSILRSYLFAKHYLVGKPQAAEDAFPALFALANFFGIKITKGMEMASFSLFEVAKQELGMFVPESFYRGFPQSVRKLTKDELLYDQLFHYATTYGLFDFSTPGRSVYEKDFKRTAFREKAEVKEFEIISEEEALGIIKTAVDEMLASTRPLTQKQLDVLTTYIQCANYKVTRCASKNTAVALLLATKDMYYTRFLMLSDVVRVVETMCADVRRFDLTNLHLSNKNRVMLTKAIDLLLNEKKADVRVCYEKKKVWNGLLHHIHYKPKDDFGKAFVDGIRGKGNLSAYSEFERILAEQGAVEAAQFLKQEKGNGAVLRNLRFLLSRCRSVSEEDGVMAVIECGNPIILVQMILQLGVEEKGSRSFVFTRNKRLIAHPELNWEVMRRKSRLDEKARERLVYKLRALLASTLRGKLGKVYISPSMKKIAIPIQETTGASGYGVLPKGSRIPIDIRDKKIRAFTYWELVNDIDISVQGITYDGELIEFSWRTMIDEQCEGITFSGDQTSGYNGGSEFFDVDIKQFRKQYPEIRSLVFCNNVYSRSHFDKCYCKAGYMLRDRHDTGNVFEPKTVESSFIINAPSTYACLFAIDLDEEEFIWLNLAMNVDAVVAGNEDFDHVKRYFHWTKCLNMADLFGMMATEVVKKPEDADVIVGDDVPCKREDVEIIHSYDIEKVTALLG